MPDSFSHSVRLSVPPAHVWPILQQPETWAGIAGIRRVYEATHDAEGELTGFGFTVEAGGATVDGRAKRTKSDPPELLELSITSSELVGAISTRIAENDASGAKLRVVLEMRPKGFLAGMFYPLIAQTVAKNLPGQVDEFAQRLHA